MEDINLREIEIFLAVARNQNISKTAEELYISQSALSSRIARMEEYCGKKLFRRTNRGVVLTPEGEELYASLDIAYKRFKVAVEEIIQADAGVGGSLRIGCLNRKAAVDIVRKKTEEFSLEYPDIKPPLIERFNFHELRDRLLCEQLDLAVTISSDIEPYPEFEMLPLTKFPVYFHVKKGIKETGELNGRTLLVETRTNRGWAEQVCSENRIVPGSIRYVNSYILMSSLAASGECFAIDGELVTDNIYTPETDLIPAELSADIRVVLAWKKERRCEMMQRFISFCRDIEFP